VSPRERWIETAARRLDLAEANFAAVEGRRPTSPSPALSHVEAFDLLVAAALARDVVRVPDAAALPLARRCAR
jgi:hypothetical protein